MEKELPPSSLDQIDQKIKEIRQLQLNVIEQEILDSIHLQALKSGQRASKLKAKKKN